MAGIAFGDYGCGGHGARDPRRPHESVSGNGTQRHRRRRAADCLWSARAARVGGGGNGGVPAMSLVYDPQTGTYQMVRPVYAGDRLCVARNRAMDIRKLQAGLSRRRWVTTPRRSTRTPVDYPGLQAPVRQTARPVRTAQRSVASVERPRGRDWRKTALVIGGSTATGAGIGAAGRRKERRAHRCGNRRRRQHAVWSIADEIGSHDCTTQSPLDTLEHWSRVGAGGCELDGLDFRPLRF